MKFGSLDIQWLGHSGFLIKNPSIIYIDPYNIRDGLDKADYILITHSHYDHCSVADMQKIIKEGTRIIITPDGQSKITRFETPVKIEVIEPGQELSFGDLKITAVPAYNIDKHFHSKDEQWVGYVIKSNGTIVYHAGDTDFIPEMQKLTGYSQPDKQFLALLPVGGRFTMSSEEAVEAAKLIKPTMAIPMHYGTIVGSDEDAKDFVNSCKEFGISAEILEKL